MQKLALRVAAFVLLSCLAGGAFAAAGTAVGVDPDAEARGAKTRTLVVGADIFVGDRIVTDAQGLVQIIFDDKTKLVVGPRSALLIDDYLIRNDGSAGKLAINALSGTFRFITGNSAKGKYVITTPTGQIGVRGTSLDLYIIKAATYVLQLHGATTNCSRNGECETIDNVCGYGVIKSSGVETAERIEDFGNGESSKASGWFSLAKSQGRLLRPFRVSGAERCLRSTPAIDNGPPQSLSDGPVIRRPPKYDPKSDSID